MVIKVSWRTVTTPTLAGSPHSVEMYYEVDSVQDTAKVIHHLRDTVKFLDPAALVETIVDPCAIGNQSAMQCWLTRVRPQNFSALLQV